MKRLVSILLLFLFLLNVLGYYGIFVGWRISNSREIKSKLDREDYTVGQMLTIKIPMSLPYHIDQEEYERVDGEFQHEGEFYRLVKQKLHKDTLYIVCVKDNQTKEIHQALTDYVKTFADSPLDATSPNGKTVPTFIKDYITSTIVLKSQNTGWTKTLFYSDVEASPIASFIPSINHPPEA